MLTDVLKTHRLCIIRICVLYCRSNNIVKNIYCCCNVIHDEF